MKFALNEAFDTTNRWVGEEASHGSTGSGHTFSELDSVPPGDEKRQALLRRLADRSTSEDGLDRDALMRLNSEASDLPDASE